MILRISFFLILATAIYSCKNESIQDNIVDEFEEQDSTAIFVSDEEIIDTAVYVSETIEKNEIKKEIEKKYGKQWDFCDCVRKNDSIQKVIDKMGDDDDFDPVFERMEVIDQHCKEILTTPNSTPEEREKHKKRVQKCLKNK
jgi:hypothetical protein